MEEEKPKKKRKKKAGNQTTPPSGHPSYSGGEKEHKPNWRETHASKQDITEFLNGVILLRHNVITDKPEFRVPDCDEFEALGMKYPTGRWLPFEVESIESPHDYPFDHEAIFAQAYGLYRRGFRYWFNDREMQLMARHNERFEVSKPERELISKYYRLPRPGERGEFVSSAEILQTIGGNLIPRLTMNKLGRAMTALGFESVRSHGQRGYLVVAYQDDDIKANRSMLAYRARLCGTHEKFVF